MGYWGRGVLSTLAILNIIAFLAVINSISMVHILFLIPSFILAWLLGKQYDKVKFTSERDALTGVYNRWNAKKIFDRLKRQTSRRSLTLAVFVIDVDDFKSINDNHNHRTGDKVLQLLSDLLVNVFRIHDHIIRWGGDEFIVFRSYACHVELQEIYELLNKELRSLSDMLDLNISVSIGNSLYPWDGDNLDELVNIADRKMYSNKNSK